MPTLKIRLGFGEAEYEQQSSYADRWFCGCLVRALREALKTWDSTLEPAIAQHLVPLIEGHLEKYADSTNPEAYVFLVVVVVA